MKDNPTLPRHDRRYIRDCLKFIDEYEKFFKQRMERGNSTSELIFNDFLAIVESLIGAEFSLFKMVDAWEEEPYVINNEMYRRKERPNSATIKDFNWQPIPLEQTFIDMANYVQAVLNKKKT